MAGHFPTKPLRNGYPAKPGPPKNGFDWHRNDSHNAPSGFGRDRLHSWSKPEVFRGTNYIGSGGGYYAPPVYAMDDLGHNGKGDPPYDMNGGVGTRPDKRDGSASSSDGVGDNSGSPSRGITRLFSKFADKCSINGVPFIKSSKNPTVKFVWSVLLAAATGGMIFHLYSLISTFLSYNTHSQIDLTFSMLSFPAITICNINAMRMSQRQNASQQLQDLIKSVDPGRMRGLVNNWAPAYSQHPNYNNVGETEDEDEKDRRKKRDADDSSWLDEELRDDNFLDDMSLDIDNFTVRHNLDNNWYQKNYQNSWEAEMQKSTFYQAEETFKELFSAMDSRKRAWIGHQISDMLIQCSFAGGKCMQRNFTRSLSSTYGNCYTIQYSKFVSRRSGPADGMDLILYLETSEYVPGITNGKGVQVVIHEQGTQAFPDEEGFAVASGTQTMIGLRQVEISRLSKPYGQCASPEAFFNAYGLKYTRNTCQKVCEQQMIRTICNCYDETRQETNTMLKIPKDLKPCRSQQEMGCVARTQWEFESNSSSCHCDSPCSEVKYEKTITSRQWPSPSFAEVLREAICHENSTTCGRLRNSTMDQLMNEFIQLKIFYEDLNYESLSQKADYELDQFISDIGGILGLWIGLSVLSIFEIVHLLTDIFIYIFCGRWRK